MQEVELAKYVGILGWNSLGFQDGDAEHEAVSQLQVVRQRVDVELALVAAVRRPKQQRTPSTLSSSSSISSSLGPALLRLGQQAVVDEALAFDDAQVVFGIRPVQDAAAAAASVGGVVLMLDDGIDAFLLKVFVVVEGDAGVAGMPDAAVRRNHQMIAPTSSSAADAADTAFDAAAGAFRVVVVVVFLEDGRDGDFEESLSGSKFIPHRFTDLFPPKGGLRTYT